MHCRVLDGGVLKSKSHVNLPGIRVNLPAITQKDRRDILFGMNTTLITSPFHLFGRLQTFIS